MAAPNEHSTPSRSSETAGAEHASPAQSPTTAASGNVLVTATGLPSSGPSAAGSGETAEARLAAEAEQLCAAMKQIHSRGWCDGTGGNFSCVVGAEPVQLLMAPSGVNKGALTAADLILVDGAGTVRKGEGRASAETLLHLAIVGECAAGAVLHTHSQSGTLISALLDPASEDAPFTQLAREETAGCGAADQPPAETTASATTSATSGRRETAAAAQRDREHGKAGAMELRHLHYEGLEMLKGLQGISSHQSVVNVPVFSNDQDLHRLSARVRPHLSKAPFAILIAGHGLYAWGADLNAAMRHLEIHEFLLEQYWRRLLINALQRRPTQEVFSQ